jgi:hypothetical protein
VTAAQADSIRVYVGEQARALAHARDRAPAGRTSQAARSGP